ncbi:unnamed protein product [Gordionus sp. m RMFG-2023]
MVIIKFSFIFFCVCLGTVGCSLSGFDDIIRCHSCCSQNVQVMYDRGEISVNNGTVLKTSQVKDQPSLKWKYAEDSLYTLIKIDPDAPSKADPTSREWRHWLVVNIPRDDVNEGNIVSSYKGAGPPKGTGFHRYIFLVYKQNGRLDSSAISTQ